jgi:hypothetical protein
MIMTNQLSDLIEILENASSRKYLRARGTNGSNHLEPFCQSPHVRLAGSLLITSDAYTVVILFKSAEVTFLSGI